MGRIAWFKIVKSWSGLVRSSLASGVTLSMPGAPYPAGYNL
jgi:hypothetical protein